MYMYIYTHVYIHIHVETVCYPYPTVVIVMIISHKQFAKFCQGPGSRVQGPGSRVQGHTQFAKFCGVRGLVGKHRFDTCIFISLYIPISLYIFIYIETVCYP